MTPLDLRNEAARLDAAGRAALARGDADAAADLFHRANNARAAAAKLETLSAKALPKAVNATTIDSTVFTQEHKVALSRAATSPKDRFAKAVQDAGMTMGGLARAIGLHPSHVTLARQGKRPMPSAKAEMIERLTGYPKALWPRLS